MNKTPGTPRVLTRNGGWDAPTVRPYEERLDQDARWALSEGSRFFEERGAVHEALRKITRRLDDLGVPYAIAGGMALFHYGFRRFTEDVDILVTREGLRKLHDALDGLGYVPPFIGSRNLRDAELGVRIEFLVSGQFPGDGKPKPVAFPDPAEASTPIGDFRFIHLEKLLELKLASGMTSPERLKDLVDVQELIRLLRLPREFAERLDPFVRDKYGELWRAAQPASRTYVRIWKDDALTRPVRSMDELITLLPREAELLQAMKTDGVTVDPEREMSSGTAYLVVTDAEAARKYDMHDEAEFWDTE